MMSSVIVSVEMENDKFLDVKNLDNCVTFMPIF